MSLINDNNMIKNQNVHRKKKKYDRLLPKVETWVLIGTAGPLTLISWIQIRGERDKKRQWITWNLIFTEVQTLLPGLKNKAEPMLCIQVDIGNTGGMSSFPNDLTRCPGDLIEVICFAYESAKLVGICRPLVWMKPEWIISNSDSGRVWLYISVKRRRIIIWPYKTQGQSADSNYHSISHL